MPLNKFHLHQDIIDSKKYYWSGTAWIEVPGGTGGMEIHANEYHDPDMEVANANIQTHVTGTGSPHTAVGVGAEASGAVATHAALATGIHGVGVSTVESVSGSTSKVSTHAGLTSSVHGFDASGNAPAQAHDLAGTKHNADTLANLNLKISDADVIALAGQIGGTAASPDIRGVRETGGPTLLTLGAVADGQVLTRSGATVIGSVPGGGASELWEGKVHVALFDGNPLAEPFQALSNNTTISPVVTPTNIGVAVGRIVAFRFKTAITVTTIRWYGIAAVSAIYTAAIYRDSDGARLWAPTNVNTLANAWSNNTGDGLPITFAADTLYWFGIGADTTGTTGGFITPQLPKVAAFGLAAPAFTGLTTVGLRFCQIALTAGVFPATLPTKVNAGAWTGFIPVFYLCASGY